MNQLILTRIDPVLDERQAEHLGPWSLPEAQFFEWEWKKYGIEPPLRGEEVHFVSRRLEKVCEFYLAGLSIRQNERHGRSYSNRYWRILLMPWLVNLVMCAFERFLRIRNRIKSGVPHLVYLAPRDETLSSITTHHFNQMMIDDPLNRLIFSRFIRVLQPRGWVMREGAPAPEDSYFSSNSSPGAPITENYAVFKKVQRKMEVYRWASIMSSNLGFVHFHKVHGLSPLDAAYISLRMLFRNRRRWREAAGSFQKTPEAGSAHLTWEDVAGEFQSIRHIAAGEAEVFLSVLDALVSETMPRVFTEHYFENEKKALLKVKATAPWTDTIAYGHLGNDDQSNFYVAALIEKRPVRLVINQHGGNYGIIKSAPWHHLTEYETADRFISWGVESSIRLSGKRPSGGVSISFENEAEQEARLNYRSGHLRTHCPSQMAGGGLPARRHTALYEGEGEFYRTPGRHAPLPPCGTGRTCAGETTVMTKPTSKDDFPDVKILHGKLAQYMPSRLSPALAGCGVCVLDRPGTTAAFTMAAGIPTLFFGHQNAWRISHYSKPYFNKLSSVSVHHSSGESAARHLNAIWPDVDSWWEDGQTREAVAEFARRYYRSNRYWRSEWLDIFSSPDSDLWRNDEAEMG